MRRAPHPTILCANLSCCCCCCCYRKAFRHNAEIGIPRSTRFYCTPSPIEATQHGCGQYACPSTERGPSLFLTLPLSLPSAQVAGVDERSVSRPGAPSAEPDASRSFLGPFLLQPSVSATRLILAGFDNVTCQLGIFFCFCFVSPTHETSGSKVREQFPRQLVYFSLDGGDGSSSLGGSEGH